MLRARTATGGVLDTDEQSAFHEKVHGVSYRSAEEHQRDLEKVVRPFESMQLKQVRKRPSTASARREAPPAAAKKAAAAAAAVVQTAATKVHAAASSKHTTVRPSTAAPVASSSSSHKKSSSSARPSTAAAKRASSTTRRTTTTTASSALSSSSSVGDIRPLARQPHSSAVAIPTWLVPSVHAPARPNAPSEMTREERKKLHEVDLGKHARKQQKATTQGYAKSFTNASPSELLETNSQITIERHARPIIVRPPPGKDGRSGGVGAGPVVKFVPIGHVVGVRPNVLQERDGNRGEDAEEKQNKGSTPAGQKDARHVKFTPAMREQENDLTVHGYSRDSMQHRPSDAEQARRSFEQIQSELRPHGLFSQVDRQRLQREEQMEMEREQRYQLDSSPKPLPSPPLQTPHSQQAPQPYSAAFQQPQQASSERSSQPHSQSNELPKARSPQPEHSSPAAASAASQASVSPKSTQSADVLTSPSPVRSHQPQPQSITTSETDSSPSNPSLLTPSKRSQRSSEVSTAISEDLARRKLEAEHEKQMKSYLSPQSERIKSVGGSAGGARMSPTRSASKKTLSSPHFTPNPYRTSQEAAENAADGGGKSDLFFYAPKVTRPPDLPPMDPRKGVIPTRGIAGSLSPLTSSDPHRELSAHLRGPRLKYEVAKREAEVDLMTSPLTSPRKEDGSGIAAGDSSSGTTDDADGTHASLRHEMTMRALQRAKLEAETRQKWAEKWQHVKERQPVGEEKQPEQPQQPAQQQATRQTVLATPSAQPAAVSSVAQSQSAPAQPALVGGRLSEPQVTSRRNSLQNILNSAASSSVAPPSSSPSLPPVRVIAVGSQNATKVDAVRSVVDQIFASVHDASYLSRSGRERSPEPRRNEVVGVNVPSGVSAQPLSASETRQGAIARAKAALASTPSAEYGVGVEGGLECVEARDGRDGMAWYESAWVAVVDRRGKLGTGTSARFEISEFIAHELLSGRTELAEIADRLSGQTDVRSTNGWLGVITNDLIKRKECQMQGIVFAFAPFISPNHYWENSTDATGAPVGTGNQAQKS
jgi:inosine/xanthosine triphosphatase